VRSGDAAVAGMRGSASGVMGRFCPEVLLYPMSLWFKKCKTHKWEAGKRSDGNNDLVDSTAEIRIDVSAQI